MLLQGSAVNEADPWAGTGTSRQNHGPEGDVERDCSLTVGTCFAAVILTDTREKHSVMCPFSNSVRIILA